MTGEVLLLGVIVTIEPLPIIGFITVQSTPGGVRKGTGFILGWVACLAALFVATANLLGNRHTNPSSSSGAAVSIAYLLAGLLLLLGGIRRHNHPKLGPTKQPGWLKKVDDIGFWGAVLLGVLLQPWPLVAAGAAKLSQHATSTLSLVINLVAFGVLCTLSLLVLEGLAIRSPEATQQRLNQLRGWIENHRNGCITALMIVIGVWAMFQGTYGLIKS